MKMYEMNYCTSVCFTNCIWFYF